jgi:hypothetical protein
VNWAFNNGEIERPIRFLKLPEVNVDRGVLTVDGMARL